MARSKLSLRATDSNKLRKLFRGFFSLIQEGVALNLHCLIKPFLARSRKGANLGSSA